MKYVIVKAGDQEYPVIFPDQMVHKDVAMHISAMLHNHHNVAIKDLSVSSAGFVPSASLRAMVCDGKSESLEIGSRPDDATFIATIDYNGLDRMNAALVAGLIGKAIINGGANGNV